jgi:DNA-binding CsgD family transcriptional regulator
VATARPWPADAVASAQDLVAQGLARMEVLAPLSAGTVRGLLRSRVRGPLETGVVEQAVGLCGGNPLLVEQVALELARSGRLPEGQVWFSRFVGAGVMGQRYLQAASVLGTRFRAAVATEVAQLSPSGTASGAAGEIDGLFRGGLLHADGPEWARFTHALIRQGVYEDIAPPVRRDLHVACFRALVASGAYPAEAAEHAVAAYLVGDAQAVATLAQAGREALQAGAVQAARQHLEAGRGLAGADVPPGLLFDLGAALVASGASEEAIGVYEQLLCAELPITDRIAALSQLGQAAFLTGQVERAAACSESAAALAEQDHPELAVGALLDQALQHQAHSGPRAALRWAARAAELATARGVMQASAQAAWGALAYRCGDPGGLGTAASVAGSVDLLAASRTAGRYRYRSHPALSYATLAVQAEQFSDAERLLTEILAATEGQAEPVTLIRAAMAWIDGLCRLGRLGEALTLTDRLTELAELTHHASPLAITYRALVLLEQGQFPEAAHCLAQLSATTPHHGGYSLHRADGLELHVRAVLAYRQGNPETACALFTQLQDWAQRTGEADPSYLPWVADAIAAHLACAQHTQARELLDWIAPRASTLPSRWPKIVVATGRAALAEHNGDHALAHTHFTHALSLHDELPMPLARARTLTDYGAFLTRTGDTAQARTLLTEALSLAQECGAGWHVHRAQTEWRRAGGRTRSRKPNELSPQETTIARLAQNGRTNQEIADQLYLSIKTVETHLGHIYQKLGIRSRWQLNDHLNTEAE